LTRISPFPIGGPLEVEGTEATNLPSLYL